MSLEDVAERTDIAKANLYQCFSSVSDGAAEAYGETKRLLNCAPNTDLRSHLEDEAETEVQLT